MRFINDEDLLKAWEMGVLESLAKCGKCSIRRWKIFKENLINNVLSIFCTILLIFTFIKKKGFLYFNDNEITKYTLDKRSTVW